MDAIAAEHETGEPAGSTRTVIAADRLARLLGVPVSVLSFLEARVPQIRSLCEGGVRVYRAQDAILVAGLTELLYGEGLTLRDVYGMMRSAERERIAERGRKRLRGAIKAPEGEGGRRRARPIPPDALVRPKGAADGTDVTAQARGVASAAASTEVADILGELMECVRLLEAAR